MAFLLNVSVYGASSHCILATFYPPCEVIADDYRNDNLNTTACPVIAVLIFPQRNQRCRDCTPLPQLGLSNHCVAFICDCSFDNAYWQVPLEEQRKGVHSWCISRGMDALCKAILCCAADVSPISWLAQLHNHSSPYHNVLRSPLPPPPDFDRHKWHP